MSQTERIGGLDCTVLNGTSSPTGIVVLCHGYGAPGTDLVPIGSELIGQVAELSKLAFVFPQAPIELDSFYDSRAWWMIDIDKVQQLMMTGEFRELRDSNPKELGERRDQICNVIDLLMERYSLTADKIVVGGFSQGAMLATDVALNYPKDLGGLIAWSGTLMNEAEWTAAAKGKASMSVIQSHGRLDPILPFAGAEFLRDMLTENGHEVEFVPFDGQHTIGIEAMSVSVGLLQALVVS